MARPLKLEFPGALYHVTARGNAREAISRDDTDRAAFPDLCAEAAARFTWRCPTYCMTANHDPWVVETPEANPSRGMRRLDGVHYATVSRARAAGTSA